MKKKIPKDYVSMAEASELWGISRPTVTEWVKAGRIKGVLHPASGSFKTLIPRKAIKGPFKPVCLHCGKVIKGTKQKSRAKYCCDDHRFKYLYRQKNPKRKISR